MSQTQVIKKDNKKLRTYYEIIWVLFSITLLTVAFYFTLFLTPSIANYFFFVGAIFGLFGVLLTAKGKKQTAYFSFVECILVATGNFIYGKILVGILILTFGLTMLSTPLWWNKDYDKENMVSVQVKRNGLVFESIMLWLFVFGVFFAINSITPAYEGEMLSIVIDSSLYATIVVGLSLFFRRYAQQFYFWIFNEILFITLLKFGFIFTDVQYSITMIALSISYLINSFYGLLIWKKII